MHVDSKAITVKTPDLRGARKARIVDPERDWLPSLDREQQEARLRAKAKRRQRKSSSRDSGCESFSENVDVVVVRPGSPTIRVFDRKCRSGKSRGLPKKGGSGGKGVWGAPPEVYDLEDPSYEDEDAQEGETVYETVVLELDGEEFNKTVTPIIQEYFEHGDTNEVLALLEGLTLGRRKYEIPFLAVNLSLDGKASHRELTSCLLTNLVGKCLSSRDVAVAFDALLEELPELILDTPAAPQMLGQFIARAIADHVLPADYLEGYKGKVDCDHVRVTLNRAAVLLSIKRGRLRLDNVWGVGGGQRPVKELVKEMLGQFIARAIADHVLPADYLEGYKGKVDCDHVRVTLNRAAVLLSIKRGRLRLDNVWGVGGGQRPVKELVKEMNLLLEEYLFSEDAKEAERCVRELEVPHFHHELVYEAVVKAVESMNRESPKRIMKLLKSFWESGLVTADQMIQGFKRVFSMTQDLHLDIPNCYPALESFVELCYLEGVISKQLHDHCPTEQGINS
ncbi:Programmed cell death protein 4 [Acipenser ruthenus]|uniref:Programmed cell death protein 4 n=1 Tax=Acipenser ruthenus TaxID=7906 RepID=A0A444V416_ACIRT|nr:Programmed cell death protein 4 [Acipenser ruthenus]